jgi:peptide/nickel transport system substrate-binding protein
MRRMSAVIALAAIAALPLAPSGGSQSVTEGGTFRVAVPGLGFDSIDAALANVAGEGHILEPTCASLMRRTVSGAHGGPRVVPELAAGYPRIADGGRTYRFRIRKGLRFSTGAAVTARDVAHTINRVLDPTMKAPVGEAFDAIVGARDVLAGRAKTAKGVVARGRTLVIKLMKPLGGFQALATLLCLVPDSLPTDPEGAKAPVPSAAPYYVAEYVPGSQVVFRRNRFYRGNRPHHLDRFVIDLTLDAATILDQVESGGLDYGWVPTAAFASRVARLARAYGINKSRFFVAPNPFLRLFVLNTQGRLFRQNVRLRQAVNFAIDRVALLREWPGSFAGHVTDQYLTPGVPGYRNERIYPLQRANLARANALARGHRRGGKATLYVPEIAPAVAQSEIVKRNLDNIGIAVEVKQFPLPLYWERLGAPAAGFDIGWVGWQFGFPDPSDVLNLFEGRRAPYPNYSRFNSTRYNRLLARAERLTGAARYREYGKLDVDLARNAAPAIAYAFDDALTLVGPRTGCVAVGPYLDLTAVCLK